MSKFYLLPNEILSMIITFLDIEDTYLLCVVNKKLREIATNQLWNLLGYHFDVCEDIEKIYDYIEIDDFYKYISLWSDDTNLLKNLFVLLYNYFLKITDKILGIHFFRVQ
jgi:hypothetical protein